MKTFGAAIWGAGNVSTEHLRAYIRNPHCEIRAIGSRTEASAKAKRDLFKLDCPIYTDYQKFLADQSIDLFSICTPPENHSRETILGAQAGKHMLIEKPVATNFQDLHAMSEAVRKARVRTVVSFVLRWNEMVANAKSLIDSGALGEVFYIQTDYWHPMALKGPWLRPYTSLLAGGCHAVDMARYLMGSDAVSVAALGLHVNPESSATTNTAALLEFANGKIGKVSCLVEARMPYVFNTEVFGTDGTFRNGHIYSKLFPGQNDWAYVPSIMPASADVAHHPFQGEIDHFVQCVREGVESHVSLQDAVNTHEVCLAAEESIRRGNAKVRLPFQG